MSGDIPRRHGAGYVEILRVKHREPLVVVVLSPRLVLWPVHVAGGKTLTCAEGLGRPCRLCGEGSPVRMERWAEAMQIEPRRTGALPFTEGAVKHCAELLAQVESSRGLVVSLDRLHGPKGAVKAKVIGRRKELWDMPHASFDVRTWLMRFHHINPRHVDETLTTIALGDIESPSISNVSEASLPRPAAALHLRLAAGLEGFSGIDWNKVRAHNDALAREAGVNESAASIRDTIASGPNPASFLQLFRAEAPAGDDQVEELVDDQVEPAGKEMHGDANFETAAKPAATVPSGKQPDTRTGHMPSEGGTTGPAASPPPPPETPPADSLRRLTAPEINARVKAAKEGLPKPTRDQR